MRFCVAHELPRRLRLRVNAPLGCAGRRARIEQAVRSIAGVSAAHVAVATGSLLIRYDGAPATRAELLRRLAALSEGNATVGPPQRPDPAREELPAKRREVVVSALWLAFGSALPPVPRAAVTLSRALPRFGAALRELRAARLGADVLDAAAIGTAIRMGEFRTAGVISLLLGVGEYLKLRTEGRARRELVATLEREERAVWVKREGVEVSVGQRELRAGDVVVVRAGHVVPVDGRVVAGEALVDQSSLTGESLPVERRTGSRAYEGTSVVAGGLEIEALEVGDQTRLARIIRMIEGAEGAKSRVEAQAGRLANSLVPYVFGAAGLTAAATGDAVRSASVLLVDYSCALKLAVPLSMRACLSEGLRHGVLIRGGKFVEALARVDTVVFDKTGTLTRARPRVVGVFAADGVDEASLVRDAACVEEHFPHPFAAAIQDEARRRGLSHGDERHGEVRYVVANGVISEIDGRSFAVGSRAFLEKGGVDLGGSASDGAVAAGRSLVFVARDGRFAGGFAIEDPLRDEVPEVVARLRALGIERLVLLTGDCEANARRVAQLGFDEYRAEVSPEEKTAAVARLRAQGRCVAMVGDGINDAPALAAASVGISFQQGADLARESADVLILGPDLGAVPRALRLARLAMRRVHGNFRAIAGVNTALIGLGALGIASPAVSGVLHNATTLLASAQSLRRYLR